MATKTVVEPDAPKTEEKDKSKTLTNWRMFEEAGFIPAQIRCEGYKGGQPADLSCHTAFVPTIENVLRHADPQHGGGWFKVKFRISDSKKHPLWRELEEAGVEMKEFYCPHCDQDVPLTPRRVIYHLNGHPGRNRVNLNPQTLCMSLGPDPGDQEDTGDLYE